MTNQATDGSLQAPEDAETRRRGATEKKLSSPLSTQDEALKTQHPPLSAHSRSLLPPYAVFACAVVFFWSLSVRSLIYTFMPTVAAELQLSTAVVGIVVASLLLGYCFGSWVSRSLPGTRKARILGGVVVSLAGALLVSQAVSLFALLPAVVLTGFGLGVYVPLGLSLVVGAGGHSKGARYMAVHEVSATLGSFSGSSFVAFSLPWVDWRGSLLVWSVVGLLAGVVFFRVRDDRSGAPERRAPRAARFDRTLVYSVFSYAVGGTLVVGLISMLPTLLVSGWGLEQVQAASIVGNTRLAGLVGVGTVGIFADRWGHRRTSMGMLVLAGAGGTVMALGGYGPLFVPGMVMLAVGGSGGTALIPLIIAEAHPKDQREGVLAIASAVGGIIGMVVGPALFGLLLETGLTTLPIVITAALALLATYTVGRLHAWAEKTHD